MGQVNLKSYVREITHLFFLDFLFNEEFRGPNFSWQHFPDMIEGLIWGQCALNHSAVFNEKNDAKYARMEKRSRKLANNIATELVQRYINPANNKTIKV